MFGRFYTTKNTDVRLRGDSLQTSFIESEQKRMKKIIETLHGACFTSYSSGITRWHAATVLSHGEKTFKVFREYVCH